MIQNDATSAVSYVRMVYADMSIGGSLSAVHTAQQH